MTRKDLLGLALAATLLLLAEQAQAAPVQAKAAACYITTLKGGQYAVQTSGPTGTLNVYVNEAYVTTISKLNQAWYATKDKKARVAVYDNGSKRVC